MLNRIGEWEMACENRVQQSQHVEECSPQDSSAVESAKSSTLARCISEKDVLGTVHGVVMTTDAQHIQLAVHRKGGGPEDDDAGVRLLSGQVAPHCYCKVIWLYQRGDCLAAVPIKLVHIYISRWARHDTGPTADASNK